MFVNLTRHISTKRAIEGKSKSILTLVVASGIGALLLVVLAAVWAGAESDAAALERQRQLVTARLNDQVSRVAQDMQLMGAGYASLLADFTDLNSRPATENRNAASSHLTSARKFSEIVTHVFGYDMVFIVNASGQLSIPTGKPTAKRFNWVRPLLIPMLRGVREKQRQLSGGDLSREEGSFFASAELMRLEGRPSITGIVPIVPVTDPQEPQPVLSSDEHYLIAFRFLDGAALDALSREQGLNGARFARTADNDLTEVAFQVEASATKEPLGFIVWTPDLPGSRVIGRLAPALSIVTILLGILFFTLIVRLRRSWRELEISELNARHLSLYDVLTKLPNRALFTSKLDDAYSDAKSTDRSVVVAFIDLDRFKEVNDTFGHAVGDELILSAAQRMQALLSPADTLSRIGGDEFALILTDQNFKNAGLEFCEYLIAELSHPFVLRNGTAVAQIGCSIGISLISGNGQPPHEVLRQADVALYHAKSSGRGRCFRYEHAMDADKLDRSYLTEALRAELENTFSEENQWHSPHSNFEVFYQTIHRAGGENSACGAEALIRWRHPTKGLLSPDKFVPLAEETGLINLLGKFVLECACMTAVSWPSDHVIAVNVSPRQLKRADFAEEVLLVLKTTGLPPGRLELELTETALVESADQAQRTLEKLRRHGVKVALDDFGTGFSSLSHLVQFGIDRIKIDRSFVRLVDTKSDGTAIVAAITGLARNLGISTTAEGVETEAQRDFLSALGCSELQGYLLSKPCPVRDLKIVTALIPETARTKAISP